MSTNPLQATTPFTPDFTGPFPHRFRGSRIARALLRLGGWRVLFDGVPTLQGVIVVYPHTSNWDFLVGILAKWSIGIPVHFWGKHTLFQWPLFGRWLRWVGGVPVDRRAPQGLIGQAIAHIERERAANQFFWLALAPEGTRKHVPGWRGGFYHVTHGANVPLGLATLDYGRKEVKVTDFIRLSGDATADMARIAQAFASVRGCRPECASPLVLLGAAPAAKASNDSQTVVTS